MRYIKIMLVLFLGFLFLEACEFKNPKETKKTENPILKAKPSNQKVPAVSPKKSLNNKLQEGDIIFQTSRSSQSQAIQLASHSPYSHMGIVYEEQGKFFVYEAIQPVRMTPLQEWIKRGQRGKYVVKRWKKAADLMSPEKVKEMKDFGKQFQGKDYDLYFEWSDEKIYCSELVWKVYKAVFNVEIGALQELDSFDLSSHVVQEKMKERYGDLSRVPMDEKVISPAAMFESEELMVVRLGDGS